jgi:hypothetical protein
MAAAAPKPGLTLFQRQAQALLVHPGHHQDLPGGRILDNRRDKTRLVEF